MGKYFGTDGFRGEANIDLTVEHAYKVGRFLGWYFGKDHKAQIVIGKDTRRSSYMFEYSLVAGLTASGADAYLLHVTTTPSVSYVVRTENFDCGIMISASTTRSMTTESKSSTAWDRNWKPTSKRRSKLHRRRNTEDPVRNERRHRTHRGFCSRKEPLHWTPDLDSDKIL